MFKDIFNTYRQAFRIYLRQRTRPISSEEAEEKRLFWSKCYVFSTFICMLTATFITRKENINFSYRTDISKEEAVLEALVERPVKVHRYKFFKKVGEYDYEPPSHRRNSSDDSESEVNHEGEIRNESNEDTTL